MRPDCREDRVPAVCAPEGLCPRGVRAVPVSWGLHWLRGHRRPWGPDPISIL